ncbi:copper chaperone [Pseudomonas flavescens]|uniref:Copper chaperone n=1 Tax=Phytopseudomonas flavescens TaxID=29435 RepID=A0A1G8E997_9GAMM|nr:heavy metal-associated domain-containing protein [Pseudomonas flavescens]SDH66249.1 copper chaperone [Pseudomonas flavescens]
MASIILKVQGMSCGGCSSKVKRALEGVEGVSSAEVALDTGLVSVEGADSLRAASQRLREKIEALGFTVRD